MTGQTVVIVAIVLWLCVLSVVFYWILKHYLRLVGGAQGNLKRILDNIVDLSDKNRKDILRLEKEFVVFQGESKLFVQKVGLVRFNSLGDFGGEHSFSLAILDGNAKGFVVTSIHARERTRVYIKPVRNGKSRYKLSSEEEKALIDAQKDNQNEN